MRRFATATALLAGAICLFTAGGACAAGGGSGIVSRNGRVGTVHVGSSSGAAVRRYAGRPTSSSRLPGENGVPVLELRYDCGAGRSTSYFFDRNDRLANFITTCHRWRTANGTRIGDAQDIAEANEGKSATSAGCGDGETIERRGSATLFITFFSSGGRVRALTVAGRNGVLGC